MGPKVVAKRRQGITTTCCIITRKSASLGLGLLVVFPVLGGGTKNNHIENGNVGVPVDKVLCSLVDSKLVFQYIIQYVVCVCARAQLLAPLSYVLRLYIYKAWVFVVE